MTTRLRPFATRREVALKMDVVGDLSVFLEDIEPSAMPDPDLRDSYAFLKEAWLRFTSMLPHEYEVSPEQEAFKFFENAPPGALKTYVFNSVGSRMERQAPETDDD